MGNVLKNQHRATKRCECGRNNVYTDGRPGVPRLNGKFVCEDCYVEYLREKFLTKQ